MRRKRFLAAIIDFAIILLIGQLFMLLYLTHINYITKVIFSLIFTLVICKDNMNGQSVGKYFMRIQVVDLQTDVGASNIKTMIRNVFLCLWPIEVFFFLIKSDRRLGDYVSKTKLLDVGQSQTLKLSKNELKVLLICFVIVLALSSLGILFSLINFPLVKLLFK